MLSHRIPDPSMSDDDLNDHALQVLAHAVGITSQMVLGEEPVPFQDWPASQQAHALYGARAAVRWNHPRVRRDAELHCRIALALQRYDRRYEDLHPVQQNAVNRDVRAVLNVFAARMTDRSFLHLGHDQRMAVTPERTKAVAS